ncbi:hypothetical protein BVRB_001160 [Beta vulgaris subsp. vulgaris]|uniref:Uncharacterized protein n=1 Tax=Beta vulgaris subsp. vulgaris TaxID=3555 RepID=A0A0J8B5D2_BETVV|nr:hypothetical protein BVRB_001160 [Beta vulgaris subsp. vulgaris]
MKAVQALLLLIIAIILMVATGAVAQLPITGPLQCAREGHPCDIATHWCCGGLTCNRWFSGTCVTS